MCRVPRFSYWFFLVLALARLAHGQGVGVGVGPNGVKLSGFGEVDAGATLEAWNASEKLRMESFLEVHVDLLVKACELTDAQVDKLRLLGKGVVKRKLASGSDQLVNFMIKSELTPDEKIKEIPTNVVDKLSVSGARIDKQHEGVVQFRTRFKEPLFDHSLWIGVLRTNLSEKQFAVYEKFCLDRNQRFVEAAIEVGAIELDGAISLSPVQREKIKEIWREKLIAKATIGFPVNLEEASTMAEPIIRDRTLIEPVLTVHQRRAMEALDTAKHWDGVGWTSR